MEVMKVYIIYIREDNTFYEPTVWVFTDKDQAYTLYHKLKKYNDVGIMIENVCDE